MYVLLYVLLVFKHNVFDVSPMFTYHQFSWYQLDLFTRKLQRNKIQQHILVKHLICPPAMICCSPYVTEEQSLDAVIANPILQLYSVFDISVVISGSQ